MKLLIIAPGSNLNVGTEIIDAVGSSGSDTKILHGTVSIRHVLDTIASGEFDSFHFAGHGDETRLMFSDGTLESSLLADAIRKNGNVVLCLFNSCESMGIASLCHLAGSSYAIGWQQGVRDDVAVTFAFAFWASYKMSGQIHDAYNTGREAVIWGYPGQQAPTLLNGHSEAERVRNQALSKRIILGNLGMWFLALALSVSIFLNLYLLLQ